MYSQKNEDSYIIDYFSRTYGEDFKGSLLDIGANDGITLSNSRAFLEKGWFGDLVEPAIVPFRELKALYKSNKQIKLHNVALDDKKGKIKFYESGSFLSPKDSGLVSTIVPAEKKRWKWMFWVRYTEYEIQTLDFRSFQANTFCTKWDFITIDAEGKDWDILKQIDLTEVGCKCLCIEHNGLETQKYIDYGKSHGMNVLLINNINVVLIKKYEG